MWDIKLIRAQPEILDQSLKRRGLLPAAEKILLLDEKLRALQKTGDQLRSVLKAASKQAPSPAQIEENKKLGIQIKQNEEEYENIDKELKDVLLSLPNLVSEQTPEGLTENDNIVIKTYDHKDKKLNGKKHEEIGSGVLNNLLDKSAGAIIAGSRFLVLKTQLAKLARVLSYWLLEENIKAGYQEMYVPFMMNEEIGYGMGVLPKFSEDLFKVDTGHYLIPTAEASLVGMHYKQTMDIAPGYPLRLTACTPCFRSEAGSAGKDTTGIIRLHQFQKVEIVGFVHADDVEAEHNRLVSHVEYLLQSLGLSYQILSMCAGDLGFHSHKKYDLEVWMPGMQRYVEISSCSQCFDFQSRRLGIRVSDKHSAINHDISANESNNNSLPKSFLPKSFLPHSINGSALPIERTLAAILENYQTEKGIIVPEVLQELFGAKQIEY